MVIIAERSAFAKVVSAVWNEAVDEAAAQSTTREVFEVSPVVADALSEASYSLVRSRLMDELIDQCVLHLTGPAGELWADARATAAVADGIVYRVRCDIMEELINTSVLTLQESGEAEQLVSDTKREANPTTLEGSAMGGGGLPNLTSETPAVSSALVAVETQGEEEPSTTSSFVDTTTTTRSAIEIYGAGGASPAEHNSNGCQSAIYGSNAVVDSTDGSDNTAAAIVTSAPEAKAAVMLQSALRRKAAYREAKAMVARNFVKLYDPGSGAFYWFNNATTESSWEKPAIIDAYFKKPSVHRALQRFRQPACGTRFS